MSVAQPNLTITVAELANRTGLTLIDVTGNYDAVSNPAGYGLPGGPAIADVTEVKIKVTLNALGASYFEYVFTTASGVITDATLSLNGATPADILANLPSTAWPFVTAFELFEDYGVTIPEFDDDIFKIDYTISGEIAGTPVEEFEYTTTNYIPVTNVTVGCCVTKKFANLDLHCSCNSQAMTDALYAKALLEKITYAGQIGQLADAVADLAKLTALCNSDCGC